MPIQCPITTAGKVTTAIRMSQSGPAPLSGAARLERVTASRARQQARDRLDDLVLAREEQALLRNDLAVDADLELSGISDDQLGVHPELFLEHSGRTGRLRAIASGVAIADRDHDPI